MGIDLFVYGSLMNPKVWSRFTTREYDFRKFTLKDFKRVSLEGWPFPGIIRQPESIVKGILYVNVAAEDIQALDEYEGEEYERIEWVQDEISIHVYLYIGTRKPRSTINQ